MNGMESTVKSRSLFCISEIGILQTSLANSLRNMDLKFSALISNKIIDSYAKDFIEQVSFPNDRLFEQVV